MDKTKDMFHSFYKNPSKIYKYFFAKIRSNFPTAFNCPLDIKSLILNLFFITYFAPKTIQLLIRHIRQHIFDFSP